MGLINALGGNMGAAASASNALMAIFTSPMIGGNYSVKQYKTSFDAALMAILKNIGFPIFCDKYDKKGGNDITEQVLVTSLGTGITAVENPASALVKVSDNIVVTPRVWTIHGYMGIPNQYLNIFGTVFGAILKVVDMLGRDFFNVFLENCIEQISASRKPFKFTTIDGETVPCFFKEYSFSKSAENQNMIEVDFTIQEFRYLALSGDEQIVGGGVQGLFDNGINATQMLARCAAKAIF